MDTLKSAAVGALGGAAIGRILGIGPIGTAMGLFAGIVAGVLLADLQRGN